MTFLAANLAPVTTGLPVNIFTYHHPTDNQTAIAGANYFNDAIAVNEVGQNVLGGIMPLGPAILVRSVNETGSNYVQLATFSVSLAGLIYRGLDA